MKDIRPYPIGCPVCRAEGSPNAKLKFDNEPEMCRYHPSVQMEPPPQKKNTEGKESK